MSAGILNRQALMALLLTVVITITTTPLATLAQGNQYTVRYQGGTLATKVKPSDWGNTLTVNADEIHLVLKDGQKLIVDPHKVVALSYGQEATRRVKTYAGVALVIPFFLIRISPKEKKHFIGIEYRAEGGKNAALLLQAKNDQYRALLASLKAITGQEVQMEEKERVK